MTRLRALLVKEFIQMGRDRLTLYMMVILPLVQLLLYGYAINTDVKHLPTIVFDQSLQQESRDLLSALTSCEYFDIAFVAQNQREVDNAIDSGKAKVGIIIPPDFSQNIKHNRSGQVQVIVDASDSMAASSAMAAAQLIGQMKSQDILRERLLGPSSHALAPPIDIRIRPWYNPDFISAYYMIPGIIGTLLNSMMVMITSMAIVRERELGTFEQLIVTPMKAHELMLGKIIPYIVVGYIQITMAILAGILFFDVPIRGSIPLLYLLSALFIIASLALGILISTFSRTQMQAMQMSFFVFMPSILLSGFMWPRESMPPFFYYIGNLLPLTYYLQILRGIFLKGIGLEFLWQQVFSLIAYILIVLSISIVKFKKKLL